MNLRTIVTGMVSIAMIVVGLMLSLATVSARQPERSQYISSSQIRTYLESKGSPLASHADSFIRWGQHYDVDPRLIVAIAGAESTFGTNGSCATQRHNAWGYGGGWPSCRNFSSWDAAIERVTWQIGEGGYYFTAGRNTIREIGGTWCGSGCEHWESNVRSFYAQQGGNPDTNDLTYPDGGMCTYTVGIQAGQGSDGYAIWASYRPAGGEWNGWHQKETYRYPGWTNVTLSSRPSGQIHYYKFAVYDDEINRWQFRYITVDLRNGCPRSSTLYAR